MRYRIFAATALLAMTATLTMAADDPKAKASSEDQAAMVAWMKAMTPGDAHKHLAAMAGTFDAKVKMWMKPGATPTEGGGISTNTLALDGRWLEQRFTGTFMGMPFNGIGYTGYDNIKQRYVGTWMDNMSTAVMSSTGTANPDGKSYSFTSTMDDPMTGKSTAIKETLTVNDADHQTLEMWAAGPDGKMYKSMEIAYSRKK